MSFNRHGKAAHTHTQAYLCYSLVCYSLWSWDAKKWEFLWFPITLSCPLASPVGSCPSPIINLKQDVSRQLSSQSLLSLLRYRSVLCYRLSWLLSPAIDVFASGKERNCLGLNLPWGSFSNDLQSPHNENRSCQVVAFIHWYCCWISQ